MDSRNNLGLSQIDHYILTPEFVGWLVIHYYLMSTRFEKASIYEDTTFEVIQYVSFVRQIDQDSIISSIRQIVEKSVAPILSVLLLKLGAYFALNTILVLDGLPPLLA